MAEQITKKNDLWLQCLKLIETKITNQAYQTWFDCVKMANVDDHQITLLVPNQFHYEWLESKYRHLIDDAIKNFFNKPLIVNYSVVISNKSVEKIPSFSSLEKTLPKNYHRTTKLNKMYTFETFIEGKGNNLAKACSVMVADTPGQTPYNPLLIYSKPGLGKTHLIQAIGNQVVKKFPSTKIVYLTSERFMFEFISAIQNNNSSNFIKTYRNIDFLLLDDAHFFQSKEQTQEQFFHLFNELYQMGKQIVLTSDQHPSKLIGLKNRIISRFQSGLIVDIQPPDLETRIAILMKKAEVEKLMIPYEVMEFIAQNVKSDIRSMEGALVKLLAISSLKKVELNIQLAKNILKDLINTVHYIEIEDILNQTASQFNINKNYILKNTRKQNIVFARQIVMYLARELTDCSLDLIGQKIGKRDHSTVVHAIKVVENKIKQDKNLRAKVDEIKIALKQS